MLKIRLGTGVVALVLAAGISFAGPVADFENGLRDAYASYRAALFMTNSGKAAEAGKALEALSGKWAALEKTWGAAPPPHYADDAGWPSTLGEVETIVAKAKAEVEGGQLGEAHKTLEHVRDKIGQLHLRNGLYSFSDRMNAYHEAMEHALKAGAGDAGKAREMAAVLSYLAGDLLSHPPREAEDNADYAALAKAFEESVTAYLDAARSGDAAKLKAAVGALKPAYSKFFLKFG